MLAPFLPHVTEEIFKKHYQAIEGGRSIHLSKWPVPVLRDESALVTGALARDIVAKLRAWKGTRGLRLGQPMGTIYIFGQDAELLRDYLDDMRGTLKADRIRLAKPAELREEFAAIQPVKQKIGPAFKARSGLVSAAIEKLAPKEAGAALEKGPLELALSDGTKATVTADMVKLERASMAENMRVDSVTLGELTLLVELPRK